MKYSTTNTYQMKREIFRFSEKISAPLARPERKFFADMIYGMLASRSCLLSEVAHALQEDVKKVNTIDRLSRHLANGTPMAAQIAYLKSVRRMLPSEPIVYIDDSDVIKPEGYHFEALGLVRDGSASTEEKPVYQKGYHITEACAMTDKHQPVSIFSELHSSKEKGFTSINDITFAAIDRAIALFRKCTFAMDRGYDDNKLFLKLLDAGQDFVIRIRKNRKLFYQNRWFSATELCERRKGKLKMKLRYRGAEHDAYLSHVKVKLTASRRDVNLILVYGITEHPMMLVTNKPICSRQDVMSAARTYFRRWRIEEYFRAKKQIFGFENFRVRSLRAINALNFCLSAVMAFLTMIAVKQRTQLFQIIIEAAAPIRQKVRFFHYRLAFGAQQILSYARAGIRDWFKPLQPNRGQFRLRLPS